MSRLEVKSAFIKEKAAFWGVHQRTVKRWLARGAPLASEAEMAKFLLSQKHCADEARKKAEEVLDGKITVNPPANTADLPDAVKDAPDWHEFLEWHETRKQSGTHDPLGSLEVIRDYYSFRLEKATRENNYASMKAFSDLVVKFEKAINDNRLAAQKLGLETGETLAKSEALSMARALGFWLMRCVDATLNEICPKLVGRDFPEEIYPELDRYLLTTRVLQPMAKATTTESGASLPIWFVEAIKAQAEHYLLDGGKSFENEVENKVA